ncbi:MAG: biliverdin-producing heme oxygenase [Phaeodactylibacter sp.]|nr:biliverdin-producing heme oxygenase [Phaeodactylibacter sp.]
MSMPVLERLRQATRSLHDAVEAAGYGAAIREGALQPDAYRRMVQMNHQLHSALERALEAAFEKLGDLNVPPFYQPRSAWIAEDLQQLDLEIPEPIQFEAFEQIPEVLGALYVLEGSMLGSKFILHRIEQMPAIKALNAHYFFQQAAENTKVRWYQFQDLLQKYPWPELAQEAAVHAARRSFELFLKVYQTSD